MAKIFENILTLFLIAFVVSCFVYWFFGPVAAAAAGAVVYLIFKYKKNFPTNNIKRTNSTFVPQLPIPLQSRPIV